MRKILITDHEVMWRDGGESYTFRTSAAPGRGGDEGQREYTEKIHSLGFLYGPYNNYTDYAPVNEHWNEDWVTRHADGNYRAAWARCYNPKPAVAVQTEPKITEIVQGKFGFNTAYCDVHTSVAPWDYVDDDARVPGAGTFAATYYAYGEILLHQKRVWGGPVYSEGPNHWYYSGLTDGNYGQDQAYFVHQSGLPWLVDFDLLKIHPKENNFGMGNIDMFFGPAFWQLPDKNAALDRFLAATLAFGHTGYLAMETGLAGGIRSYFALQQLAARYGVQRVAQIRYADETGKLLTASQALASGAIELNRVKVEYEDLYGNRLRVYVNGNPELPWKCYDNRREIAEIPPNGWFVEDSTEKVKAWSLDVDGRRTDYVESPEYLFAEIRDNLRGKPCRFDRLLCDGQLIVLKNVDEQGRWEMIVGEADYPSRSTLHAVRLDGNVDAESAVALDFEGKEIGPAKTRYSRGMVHVMPVEGAFSYLVTPKEKDKTPPLFGRPGPNSSAVKVVPGQTVPVGRYDLGTFTTIPLDAKPNTLYWFREEFDKNGLDFEIIEPYKITATLDRERSRLDFTIRLPELEESSSGFVIHANEGEGRKIHIELRRDGETVYLNVAQLEPGKEFAFALEDAFPTEPGEQGLTLSIESQVYDPFFSQKSGTLLFEKQYRLVTAADSLQTTLRKE